MAANFWLSTHCKHWIFNDREDLKRFNAEDRKVFSDEELIKLRLHYIQFIQNLGRKLKVKQRVIATALVFFKRFYKTESFITFDPRIVAGTGFYLACKVEECVVSAQKMVDHGIRLVDPDYPYSSREILHMEFYMLERLQYDLIVFHPYRPLTIFVADAGLKECLQTAWNLVNDSYCTDVSFLYPPYLIAIACIYMSSVFLEKNVSQWLNNINISYKEIIDITKDILSLYEQQSRIDHEEVVLLIHKLHQCRRWMTMAPS
eukprot:GILJ01011621.1.p1 GENE.GILJ01011621.1~~GILJ01011621.1.p1  ORF type:complete len:260 (+),score=19.43 GILJ01011621.1:67-846(+)